MKLPLRILILITCSSLAACTFTNCSTLNNVFGYSVDAKTAQQVIDNANKTIAIGDQVVATFLQLEQAHRATIEAYTMEPRKYAHYLREPIVDPTQVPCPLCDPPTRSVPRWTGYLKAARAAVVSFETNRTEQGKINLQSAIRVIEDMIRETKAMTDKINNTAP